MHRLLRKLRQERHVHGSAMNIEYHAAPDGA